MADNKKPIDKEYLIDSLKNFDKEILSKKYNKNSNESTEIPSGVKDIDEIISKLNEKEYLKGLATKEHVAESINQHTEAMKEEIRNGYQKILNEDIAYLNAGVFGVTIPSDRKLRFHQSLYADGCNKYIDQHGINIDEDGYVELKAGHLYYIYPLIMINNFGNANTSYFVINKSGDKICCDFQSGFGLRYAETALYSDAILPLIYSPEEDCAICVMYNEATVQVIEYALSILEIKQPVYTNVDVASYADQVGKGEDTPIGQIISFMGNTAPQNYLACDGSEYDITDYPDLANFFKNQFGTINHFGGNGVNTFVVPDLRGEFIRGAGENSHAGNGLGADVGVHQDATTVPLLAGDSDGNVWTSIGNIGVNNADYEISANGYRTIVTNTNANGESRVSCSVRPTNTSVMYCIKAVRTFSMKLEDAKIYSEEERVVGKWTDGKLLYQKVIKTEKGFLTAAGTYNIPIGVDADFAYIVLALSVNDINGGTDHQYLNLPNGGATTLIDTSDNTIKVSINNTVANPSILHNEFVIRYTKR